MHEVNGRIGICPKLAVDTTHQLIDQRSQVLIFFEVTSSRDSNLNQHGPAHPFRVVCQECLEGAQFLREAFDVVEAVNADHDLLILKFFVEFFDSGLHTRQLECLRKVIWVDTDGKGTDVHDLASVGHSTTIYHPGRLE